jgi:prefoldin subunit 5
MACSECSRLGRPCVTSSIARLDKVVDDLSSRIEQDEEEVQKLLDYVEEVRRRIARNKRVREQNSKKLDN